MSIYIVSIILDLRRNNEVYKIPFSIKIHRYYTVVGIVGRVEAQETETMVEESRHAGGGYSFATLYA